MVMKMIAKIYTILALGFVLVLVLSNTGIAARFSNTGGESWKYYKELTIREKSWEILTEYRVSVELIGNDFSGNAKINDCDLQFKDVSGKELNYWIEEWSCGAKDTEVWANVPFIPA